MVSCNIFLFLSVLSHLCFAASLCPSRHHHHRPVYIWTQFTNEPSLLAVRALSVRPCSRLSPLRTVADPTLSFRFHNRNDADNLLPFFLCQSLVPATSGPLVLQGKPVATLRKTVDVYGVVGDTGCRQKSGHPPQNCSNVTDWPAKAVADSLGATVAEHSIVIHVGDFIYREGPCQYPDPLYCADWALGHNWPALKQDFFEPFAGILDRYVWLFLRGDHEVCTRGGPLFQRLFAPTIAEIPCSDYTDPYQLPSFGGAFGLAVMDSSFAQDDVTKASLEMLNAYRAQYDALLVTTAKNRLFLTHKPAYAVNNTGASVVEVCETLQQTSKFSSRDRLVLSGHLHEVQYIVPTDPSIPPQAIFGSGGASTDSPLLGPPTEIGGKALSEWKQLTTNGFGVLRRAGAVWSLGAFDTSGHLLMEFPVKYETG